MKILIDSVKFKNFLSYGNKWQEVNFKEGITLIYGKNGSGKSSILETIPIGFFGKGSRNVVKNEFINWKNKKNTELYITFYVDNTKYTILRAFKPDKLELYKNDKVIEEIAHDKRLIQKHIEDEIIGWNYKTFMNIVYSDLNNTNPILLMSKPDKRAFLESTFSLGFFSKLYDRINKKLRNVNESISSNNNEIEVNKGIIENLNDQNKTLKSGLSEFDSTISNIEKLESIIHTKFKDIDIEKIESGISELDSEIGLLESEKNYNVTISYKISDKIKYLKKMTNNIDLSEKDNLVSKLKDIEKIEKKYNEIKVLDKNEIKIIESNIEGYKIELEEIINNLSDNKELLAVEKSKLNPEIEENLIKGKTLCPTCKSQIDSKNLIESERKRIKEVEDNIKQFTIQIKNHEISISDIRKKINKLSHQIEINNDNINKKELLLSKLNSKDMIVKNLKNIELLEKKKERYKRATEKQIDYVKNTMVKKLKEMEDIISKKEKIKEKENLVLDSYRKFEEKLSKLYEEKENEDKYRLKTNKMIERNNDKIGELEKSNTILSKKIETQIKLKDHLTILKDSCGDDKVKQYAISTKIPYINKRTNYYLNSIGFNFYTQFDKWLDCVIKGPGITGKSLKSFSGGETRSVDLSLRFALMDLSRISSGIWFDTITADELFDSSIDSESIENIVNILKFKQKEDNMKVLLVSHNPDITKYEFDNYIEVTKEGGYSKIIQ